MDVSNFACSTTTLPLNSCVQIRDTVLAKEGEGWEARGDPCKDGHEGRCPACVVERWAEYIEEAAAELRDGLCVSQWRLRPLLLNNNLVGQQ